MATMASMNNLTKEGNTRPFPLKCLLCPKNPSFSDTSHLLTHVSSKSHLHHKFSVELKAKSEPIAREQVQRYEQWYAVNNVELLLADRLANKNQKKSTRRGRPSTASAKTRQSTSAVSSLRLDYEPASGLPTPSSLPSIAQWNDASSEHSMHYHGLHDVPFMGDAMYSTPFTQRHQSAYIFQDEVISNDTGMRHHGFVSNVNSAQTAAASDMDSSLSIGFTEDEGQANKLKGTIWPGMDLFDSATPDQKRKRNQRKDGAMIEQLKSTSEAVTATETVWNPEEGIHRVRDIYDSPSVEGSPPSTPSRKRKYRARNSTPTDDDALEVAKEEDGDSEPCKKKRSDRLFSSNTTHVRQTRAATKATEKGIKKKKTAKPAEAQAALHVHLHGNGNYGSSQQQRPVLQQLDPNLTIVEPTSCYKQSASARYGDGVRDSQHVAFRATQSSYGNGININGMSTNSTTLNHTSSQARSGSLYASLDNAMFNGNGDLGNEAPAATYHTSSNRRLGFANLTMDSNNNSFEYNGKRECTLRESGFSDETYGNSTPLFDM